MEWTTGRSELSSDFCVACELLEGGKGSRSKHGRSHAAHLHAA